MYFGNKSKKLEVAFLFFLFLLPQCWRDIRVNIHMDTIATGQALSAEGEQILSRSHPLDLALSQDKRNMFVKTDLGLLVVDTERRVLMQQLDVTDGGSLKGIGVVGDAVWISGARGKMSRARRVGGEFQWDHAFDLPPAWMGGTPYPCGFSIHENWMIVAASRDNSLMIHDLETGKQLARIFVDIAPYDVVLSQDGKTAYASCWSRHPPSGVFVARTSGSWVEVDERTVAVGGSVLAVDLEKKLIVGRVSVDLQPMQLVLLPDTHKLLVGHGNADHVSVIDTATMTLDTTIRVKIEPELPFGSMPGAIAVSSDGKTLFTANGSENAIGVFDLESKKAKGFIPVGWYPSSVWVDNENIWVANVWGDGSQKVDEPYPLKYVSAQRGTINVVPLPNAQELALHTETVRKNNRHERALAAMKTSAGVVGKAVPERLGERGPIEHVVYIIKENRTYDQVLGDLSRGDNDPNLCIFGRRITPNHHALAEDFVQLDNFYCNGVNSAEGHMWAMEGVITGYLGRSFGNFARSYPFVGDDALSSATSGHLWDAVLDAGMTFRNFGEFDVSYPSPKRTWIELYKEHQAGKISTKFTQKVAVNRMRLHTDLDYPGWNLDIPDQVRADIFLDKLAQMETFANLTTIYLPQDHTSGMGPTQPTPEAAVADNDLALGRIIDGLSKSKWWPKMAIFVIEDDPQGGFDHVDGHRSLAFVISPYAKRGLLVPNFYNQTSVIHTISRILGITPMTDIVALSPLMSDCFVDKPDVTPYDYKPAKYPIDELNPPMDSMSPAAQAWAKRTAEQDLSQPDAIDDDLMNRIVWYSVKGDKPYPTQWAGAHGRGLTKKGLELAHDVDDD